MCIFKICIRKPQTCLKPRVSEKAALFHSRQDNKGEPKGVFHYSPASDKVAQRLGGEVERQTQTDSVTLEIPAAEVEWEWDKNNFSKLLERKKKKSQ